MRLTTHRMSGFNHLGGPFEMDLASLPSGLIAIAGPNAAGKTSVALEGPLAALYGPTESGKPAFPSRDGKLADYATSRDAVVDDTWTLDGIGTFRIRVNVDGTRRSTAAVIEQILPDGRHVLLNTDGKVTSFREEVLKRFPSRTSILASAFASQNRRGGFGSLTQPERVALFRELADLQHLEDKSQTAKRCAQVAESVAAQLRAALDVLQRDAGRDAELGSQLDVIATELGLRSVERADYVRHLTAVDQECQALQADATKHAVAQEKARTARQALQQFQSSLAARAGVAEQLRAAHVAETEQLAARRSAANDSLVRRRSSIVADHRRVTATRTQRIAEQQDLLRDADQIRAAVAASQEAADRYAAARQRGSGLQAELDSARDEVRGQKEQLALADVAAADLRAVEVRAGLLGRVKFGDECGVEPACPLVLDAVSARGRLPELRRAAALVDGLREGVQAWTVRASALATSIAELVAEQADAERVVKAREDDVKRAPYVDAAEARIVEYRVDQRAADAAKQAALAALDEEAEAAEGQYLAESEGLVLKLAQQVDADSAIGLALEGQIAEAGRSVAAAEAEAEDTAGAALALARAQSSQASSRQAIADIDARLARLEAERDGLSRQRAELERRRAEAAAVGGRLRAVEDELLAWQTLAQALGRDGIQRLEIDAAGPVVSDLANQILSVGWGTRFAVQVVTQVATADKKDLKERFTIEVLDQAYGGEPRDIGDLSGGEGVVVERAIRFALLCYVNLRSRVRCRTIWMDESDSGLHVDVIPAYAAMLRKVRQMSGADQILLVTHRPELAALCDAVVTVEDGRVASIEVAA